MKLAMKFEILDMDDKFVAVPVGEKADAFKGVLQLNEEGAAIIRLLQEDTTEAQIVDALAKEYAATKEQMLQLVHCFVEQLRSNKLLVD